MILLIAIIVFYLLSNLAYTIVNEFCFNEQRAYMSLKELRSYKNMIVLSGAGAYITFDYEWGIKFTPLTYWYCLYLIILESIEDAKFRKKNKVSPPWRLK